MICHQALRTDGIRGLYRVLLRRTNKLDVTKLSVPASAHDSLAQEYEKFTIDPNQYGQQLKFELKYHLKEEFSRVYTKPESLWFAYSKGVLLVAAFDQIDALVLWVIEFRNEQFRRQQWRYESLQRSSKPRPEQQDSVPLTLSQRSKRYKKSMTSARSNYLSVVHRHIKKLQLRGQLPLPTKLPYTADTVKCDPDLSTNVDLEVYRSTSFNKIKSAYDVEYLDSIVRSDLEFDINKHHFLNNLRYIVNEKGPLVVKIGVTNGGPIAIPFIRMPYPRRRHLKEVAMDIKKSLTLFRLRSAWLSLPQAAMEKQNKDGSVVIRNQLVLPQTYYAELAEGEAFWEFLMELETGNHSAKSNEELSAMLISYETEWKGFINDTTQSLNSQIAFYEEKYRNLRGDKSKLLTEREHIQQQQNRYYDKMIQVYKNTIHKLQKYQVHKHSEIVNYDKNRSLYSHKALYHGEPNKSEGVRLQERLGMGKTLGDYLRQEGYKSFQSGEKFFDRFKF